MTGTVPGGGSRALLVGLVMTVTMVAFEALAIGAVMPELSEDLQGLSLYGWVFTAFVLAQLVGIVVSGAEVDRRGLVTPFAIGLTLFAIGLLVGGTATAMPVVLAGRAVQGFGAGGVTSVANVAVGRAYPPERRARVFAIFSTAWVVPGLVGPGVAGWVAEHLSWRLVFLGLLPIVAAAATLTLPALAQVGRGAPPADAARAVDSRRRVLTALQLAAGAGVAVTGLTTSSAVGRPALTVAGLALGVPALRRLTPPGTLRAAAGLPAAIAIRGLLTFAFFGADLFLPLTLTALRGLTTSQAGLVLTAATLTWTAGSWVNARYGERIGRRNMQAAGLVFVALGIGGALSQVAGAPVVTAPLTWGLAGLGMGAAYAVSSLTVLEEAPPGEEGRSVAALQLVDVLGVALGTGAAGAAVAEAARGGDGPGGGLAAAFLLCLAAVAVGFVAVRRVPGRPAGSSSAPATPSVA